MTPMNTKPEKTEAETEGRDVRKFAAKYIEENREPYDKLARE